MPLVVANLASTISAIATVVLVIVTAVYVVLTWKMVQETQQARKQEVMPVMNLDIEPFSVGSSAPVIENVGNGPALDATATFKLVPGGEEYEIQSKNIPSGDFSGASRPRIDADTHEEYDSLTVEGEYTDVFGDRDDFEETYDLELLANSDPADSIMKRDQQAQHLKSIDKRLESIAKGIEMDGFEQVLEMESRGRILAVLQECGPLTVEELAAKTGMMQFELAGDLTRLYEAGAVEYDVERDEIFDTENSGVEVQLRDVDSPGKE